MDFVWSPWRYHYIRANADGDLSPAECIFCFAHSVDDPASTLVIARGALSYVILNLYPYTSGHLMVVPYAHVPTPAALDDDTLGEMMRFVQMSQTALDATFSPHGYNIGMNIGKAAGAGIAEHLHLHVVPRWVGDANFVSVVGETRVVPEDLAVTYEKLVQAFARNRGEHRS
ncbi:MAG: HIT domain-containing protein [Acidobacteria bacterium]|nr:HIT domain-containing protein [Acidobacteriota bacterium]